MIIFFSYQSFSLNYLELQIIFPCRDIGPATRDQRPATISQTHSCANQSNKYRVCDEKE